MKLDDSMPNHPKVMAAGAVAFALDVAGICYSNRHATDGFIPASALSAVLPSLRNASKHVAKLVDSDRWVSVEGGWMIHDIGDYQPSAAETKELSKKRAEAGRKGGSHSRSGSKTEAKQKQVASETEANAKQVANRVLNPVPSRPVPSR